MIEKVNCVFCGKEEDSNYKNEIGETKYEKDINVGKHACDDCLSYDNKDYFQCAACDDWFHYDSFGGSNYEIATKGVLCRDCFKGR